MSSWEIFIVSKNIYIMRHRQFRYPDFNFFINEIFSNLLDFHIVNDIYYITTFCITVAILLSYGKHLHNHNISLWEEAWVHKTSLTQPLTIEVSVPSQESERSCIYVLGVSFFPLSTIFQSDFWTDSTEWYFLFFIL